MANFDFDLGLLEHQLHLARQNAIQTELAAAGLQEVGHPMLMCILRTAGARGADGLTQRELADACSLDAATLSRALSVFFRPPLIYSHGNESYDVPYQDKANEPNKRFHVKQISYPSVFNISISRLSSSPE